MANLTEQHKQPTPPHTSDLQAINARLQHEITERERIERELQAHIAFESIIIAISTDFINVPTDQIDTYIQQSLQTVSTFAGVDRSYVFLFSNDTTTMSNIYEWCNEGIEPVMPQMQNIPINDFAWSNNQILQREILHIPRIADLPPEATAERTEFERQSIQSLIAVPMPTEERVIGFLGFDSVRQEIRWKDESITLLKIIGQILVNALQRKQHETQLRESQQQLGQHVAERTRQLHALLEVQRLLSSRLNPDDVMQMIAEEARQLIGASFGALFVREEEHLRVAALAGTYGPQMKVGYRMPLRQSATGLAMLSHQPVRTSNLDDPRVNREAMNNATIQSMVGVPLLSGETPIGVISVGSHHPDAFTETDEQTLTLLAPGATVALENAHLYAQAQQVAALEERQRLARDLHDAVTQTLFSASMIADVMPRLWQRSPDEAHRRIEELRQLTRGALAEMRTLLLELRPAALIEANLGDIIQQLGEAIAGRARLPITTTVSGKGQLPPEVQIACYRIAQEALNNTVKHACASHIEVHLALQPDTVSLRIHDNGCGFDPSRNETGHFGIDIMHERATSVGAHIHIESSPNQGTTITVTWNKVRGEPCLDRENLRERDGKDP